MLARPKPQAGLPDPGELLAALVEQLQHLVDQVLLAPTWLALAVLGFSLLLVLLHRHGMRPLSGALLGAFWAAGVLLLVAPRLPNQELTQAGALVGAGLSLLFGLVLPGQATALVCGMAASLLGGKLAVLGGTWFWVGAVPCAPLGFFTGLVNHRAFGLWLPPLAAALGLTFAAVHLLGSQEPEPLVPILADGTMAGVLFAVLLIALLALSFEREHRHGLREEAKKRQLGDAALKQKIAQDRERFEKHLGSGS